METMIQLGGCRSTGDTPDRLSRLPDDILICNILSLLPIKDAARTSLLSRRWRFMWLHVPVLDFAFTGTATAALYSPALEYIEWVNRVIGGYRGLSTLRHFCIRFCLGKSHYRDIHSWIKFSLTKGTDILELDLAESYLYPGPDMYTFPASNIGDFPNLRILRSLILKGMRLTDETLTALLSSGGCESLEQLHLAELYSLNRIEVAGPKSRLKHIEVSKCSGLEAIMISATTPDLVSFRCCLKFGLKCFHIEHAPRLADLLIYENIPQHHLTGHQIVRYFSQQLQSLHLDLFACGDAKLQHWLPKLSGLNLLCLRFGRHSDLEGQLRILRNLIEELPNSLQQLALDMECLFLKKELLRMEEFAGTLHHVRVLEIKRLDWGICWLLQSLLEGPLKSVEKLIIDQRWEQKQPKIKLGSTTRYRSMLNLSSNVDLIFWKTC